MSGLSYLSTPYKPEPYVAPFDLSTMASVLSQEQGKFDEEGKKEQNQLDQFANLDVLKGVDKQYLNSKINSLVSGLNDLGGVNLADQNVSSKIEGMGSTIAGDPNIVNAIASTRQIRSLQASYEKMKTDPKLTKQYSPVNEAWDNQFVNAYASDDKVGGVYGGPSTATPYSPYRDNLTKLATGLKANWTPNITTDGVTYTDTEGKIITPQRVMQMSADLLLPDEKKQMEKDGWFAFKDAHPLDVVQQSLNYNNQKLQDAQMLLDKYTAEGVASASDPVAQARYKDLIEAQRTEVNQYTATSKQIQTTGLQQYNQNPQGYMAQVYKDQFYRGMGERFASSEITSKLSNNPMMLAQMKMQQQEDQFNQRMLFNVVTKGGVEGRDFTVDPKTGKVILTGSSFSNKGSNSKTKVSGANLAPLPVPDVNDPDLYKKTEQSFIDQNKDIDVKKADLFNTYWQSYLNDHPDVSQLLQSNQSGSGVSIGVPGQKILESLNGVPGFQVEDLGNIDKLLPPQLFSMEMSIAAKNPGMTLKQAKDKILSLKQIYTNFEQLSHLDTNPDINPTKVDPKLSSMVEQYQLLDEQKSANEEKMKGVNNSVYKSAGLTDSEINTWENYIKSHSTEEPLSEEHNYDPITGTLSASDTSSTLPSSIAAIKAKINSVDPEAIKNEYYKDISNRPVYSNLVFTKEDPLLSSGWLQNSISKYINVNGSTDLKLPAGFVVPENKIFPTDAGRNKSGNGYSVTANIETGVDDNKQPVYKAVTIDLTPDQSKQLGFNTDPYEALNQSVALRGSSNPLIIAAPGANGKTLVTKVRIIKDNLTDRTDQTSHAQLVVQTAKGVQYVNLPNITGETPSQVYATMKTAITNMAQKGLTLPVIVNQLLNQGN